jgi:hypothetical protein
MKAHMGEFKKKETSKATKALASKALIKRREACRHCLLQT